MDVSDYGNMLRKRWLSVALVTLLGLSLGALASLLTPTSYTATSRLYFAVQGGTSVSELNQGSSYAEAQMSSYAQIAESPLVLDVVADQLGLTIAGRELASSISVSVPPETAILEITAVSDDPGQAADIANAVAEQLGTTAGTLAPAQVDGSETVRATVLATAELPLAPSSPNVSLNLTLGFVTGLMLGLGFALLREATDQKVRTEDDVRVTADAPVLGVVSLDESANAGPLFQIEDPHGVRSEEIRRVRTNLQFVDMSSASNSVVVTSSVPGEGKSTTAIALALSLADTGSRVMLVDADLRRPALAKYLGLEGRVGLTTVLIGKAEVRDVAHRWAQSSLTVLPAGQIPPNPSELLGSRAMSALLRRLCEEFDIVVLDSPPLLPVTDAAVLSRLAGGALVVIGANRIRKSQLRETLSALHSVDAKVHGAVLNMVRRSGHSRDYYGSYLNSGGSNGSQSGLSAGGSRWPGKPLARGQRD